MRFHNDMHTIALHRFISKLPCNLETKVTEIQIICEQLRSGQLIAENVDANTLECMIDKW